MDQLDRDAAYDVQRFVIYESALLDEMQWEAWRALFTNDGSYWMPLSPDQPDAINHVSLIFDDTTLMAMRCRRLQEADTLSSLSLHPFPRTLRFLSNFRCHSAARVVTAHAHVMAVQHAAATTRVFYGRVRWELAADGGIFRIRQKRVHLLNDGDNLPDILVYI